MSKSEVSVGSTVSFNYVAASDGLPRVVEQFKVEDVTDKYLVGVRVDGAIRRYTKERITNLR